MPLSLGYKYTKNAPGNVSGGRKYLRGHFKVGKKRENELSKKRKKGTRENTPRHA